MWLTNHCRDTLLSWRATLGSTFTKYVFPSFRISGAHTVDYKKAWKSAAQAAGIPDRRIYDLRATFASRANACHASEMTVAHLLGHATTHLLPTYVRPLDENTKAVLHSLDDARAKLTAEQQFVQ